jgi:hypothetical protein
MRKLSAASGRIHDHMFLDMPEGGGGVWKLQKTLLICLSGSTDRCQAGFFAAENFGHKAQMKTIVFIFLIWKSKFVDNVILIMIILS